MNLAAFDSLARQYDNGQFEDIRMPMPDFRISQLGLASSGCDGGWAQLT
jgi:hypothetical protein